MLQGDNESMKELGKTRDIFEEMCHFFLETTGIFPKTRDFSGVEIESCTASVKFFCGVPKRQQLKRLQHSENPPGATLGCAPQDQLRQWFVAQVRHPRCP